MSAKVMQESQLTISENTIRDARDVRLEPGVSLSLVDQNGNNLPLSSGLEDVLLQAMASIARNGEVSISRVPEELSSNAAADILGVSRPTLLKWAREGVIPSFKVGTHTRFKREAVMELKSQRAKERRDAFARLRDFEWENRETLDIEF